LSTDGPADDGLGFGADQEHSRAGSRSGADGRGSSPYATGGGGVSFAHRVAAVYLTSMLTRSRRSEARDLPVQCVRFQTGPTHAVDDLLVECSDGQGHVSLAVACRATPNFVESDDATVKLVRSLLAEVAQFDSDTHQVAVATAGWSNQWEQLAALCAIARSHADSESFHASLDIEGRWPKRVRERWQHFVQVVTKATDDASAPEEQRSRAWRLLSRLHLIGFGVQGSDETDRTATATLLDAVARETADGVAIRDRLEVEATRYDATGAVVDRKLLRRDVHDLLDSQATRNMDAWNVLAEHRRVAGAGVRTTIGPDVAVGGPLAIPFIDRRADLAKAIRSAGSDTSALVVSGDSGTGKSALTLSTIAELEASDPTGFEAIVLNFRGIPQTTMELRAALGVSIEDALGELSARCRLLVVDAADAALERSAQLLTELMLSAAAAGVGVVAVASDTAADFVRDQMSLAFETRVSTFRMDLLGDDDIATVSEHFPLLRALLRDLPAASLFRRLVALDLLARTELRLESSMTEWECLELVWSKIVRGEGRPGAGSAEARAQTLLAVAAATLRLPLDQRPSGGMDGPAVDALRRDHLLAPASPYRVEPEFAHDEVRRYATAILLVRAAQPTEVLETAGAPRWALAAATLACKGQLQASGVRVASVYSQAVAEYNEFASKHGARWADVPIEAVFETPTAYECLKDALEGQTSRLELGDVVRVVVQRHQFNGLVDHAVAAPVIRVLLDEHAPWAISKESFKLLASWLSSLCIANEPSGNALRVPLRSRLLSFWDSHPQREQLPEDLPEWVRPRRRQSRRVLDYHVTDDEFLETMALLGPDIDERVEGCLRVVAEHAPAFLAPAVDSPLSARAIAMRDPELLATLMEAYYIDEEHDDWSRREGLRDHQGRWRSFGPPFSDYYFGGFWQLFNVASLRTSVRVLNKILNHGARARVDTSSTSYIASAFENSEMNDEDTGAVLNLDGTPRLFVGDSSVWNWYRATSVGPNAASSALLAMERLADGWLQEGARPARVVEILLEDCENLAVPGMIFGLLVRHLEKVGTELDRFLAEPLVWELEFARATSEFVGLRANTEGLANLERRRWSPREVSVWLLTRGDEPRREVLKGVASRLIQKGDELGIDPTRTRAWAASLDVSRYEVTQEGDEFYLQVVPPPEVLAAQEELAAYQEHFQTSLRLQNRYWGSAKHDPLYEPPTAVEIAADLAVGRALLATGNQMSPDRPLDAVAHVVRAAVDRAAGGEMDALGDNSEFVAQFVLELALSFKDLSGQRQDDQYYDLGADRAVALALPAFLMPTFAELLARIGVSVDDVADAGLAMAGRAALEARLYLARGCDVLWETSCSGSPCLHEVALGWLTETARGAEIGPWEMGAQRRPHMRIEGNVTARLLELDAESIAIGELDPVIRGLGSASASSHCLTGAASSLLATLLDVQARTMVIHEDKGWTADYRGNHTLVTARALLECVAGGGPVAPVLEHLDVLRADASLMLNFLHGLAAAGAENYRLADAARSVWPALLSHALSYIEDGKLSPYEDDHWGDWTAAALLPDPITWTQGMYNEVLKSPIDWVESEDLLDLLERWLPTGRGESMCVDALIRILRKRPMTEQVTTGLRLVEDLCTRDGRATVKQSWTSNDWLKEIRSSAEEIAGLGAWQRLVDAMVVAGNETLAPYSR